MPPLWLTMPIGPSIGSTSVKRVEKLATAPLPKFARPCVFGPTKRMPPARAAATMRSWTARPAGPVSPKPEAITTAQRTPRAAQSSTTASVCSPATMTRAISGTSGSAARLG